MGARIVNGVTSSAWHKKARKGDGGGVATPTTILSPALCSPHTHPGDPKHRPDKPILNDSAFREVGGVRTGGPTKDTKYSTANHCPLEHLFLREKIRRHIIVGKSNSRILYRHRFSVYYLL